MMRSSRKPRPLDRDMQTFRDDRLYLVACDDTYAPDQYFKAYKKDFLGARLQVNVVPTEDGTSSAEHVLDRLLAFEIEEYDQRWLLLDTDHYIEGNHRNSFLKALSKARQENVRVALSRPCFEFWLVLHHLEAVDSRLAAITNAKSVEDLLRKTLGAYNKKKLNMEDFPVSSVPKAVAGAEVIDKEISGGDIPERATSRVYQLWQEIIMNAAQAQLPSELRDLKEQLSERRHR